jgi:hypothetical protein
MKYLILSTVFVVLNVIYFTLISAAIFRAGHFGGTMNERVKIGSVTYFVLVNTRDRFKQESADIVSKDLDLLLLKMHDKNTSGVNGPAMIEYLNKFSK